MTIDAADLNRRARFVVENAVAVRVSLEMTVNTVHPFLKMNVVKMNCFLESIRIVRRNNRVLRVEQVPFPISLKDLTKDPAVPMKVGKLRALKLAVEFRRAGLLQKVRFRPQTAQARAFRITVEFSLLFRLRRIVLFCRVHLVAISFVV